MEFVREATAIREAIRKWGKRGLGRRCLAELKRQGEAYLRARHAVGAATSAAARELGLRRHTLESWVGPASLERPPLFRPVSVTEGPAWSVVVHGPAGLRIEGLAVGGVAELLRRLE